MIARPIRSAVLVLLIASFAQALDIVPTWDNGVHTWTAAEKAVVEHAILEWEGAINMPGTVDIGFGWEHAGVAYAAVTYLWNWPSTPGANWHPWSGEIGHHIAFNRDAGWYVDPNPSTDEGFGGWDLLTTARHELGHALGHFAGFWFDDVYISWYDRWEEQIVGNTFDPGGLNVAMVPGDHGHVAGSSELMGTTVWPGVRHDVSETLRAMINKAHDYDMYPDFNKDLVIDTTDLTRLATYYGSANATWEQGDANFDGVIDTTDLTILATEYGQSWPDDADTVPEPTSLMLLAVAGAGLLRRRRSA